MRAAVGDRPLRLSVGGATGRLRATEGGWLLLAGTGILEKDKPDLPAEHADLRARLRGEGKLVPDESNASYLRLTEDVLLDSPAAAAAVVYGGAIDGATAWKGPRGRTLGDLEAGPAAG